MSIPTYFMATSPVTEELEEPRCRCSSPSLYMRGLWPLPGPRIPFGHETPVEGTNLTRGDFFAPREPRCPSPDFRRTPSPPRLSKKCEPPPPLWPLSVMDGLIQGSTLRAMCSLTLDDSLGSRWPSPSCRKVISGSDLELRAVGLVCEGRRLRGVPVHGEAAMH